jgi:hypothetical protein
MTAPEATEMSAAASRRETSARVPVTSVSADPTPIAAGPAVADVDVVAALVALLEERDRAIEALTTVIAELKVRIDGIDRRFDRLFAPEAVPEGYIALRKAAALIKKSDEYLRQRAARGEIAAEIIRDRWYVDIGALAVPNENEEG